jgi:hypothetical protein
MPQNPAFWPCGGKIEPLARIVCGALLQGRRYVSGRLFHFMDRLVRQRGEPHTLASYRDTFRLRLQYAQRQLGKAPSALALPDLDNPFLGAFLDHLEQKRDNSARSRNVRLSAILFLFPLRGAATHLSTAPWRSGCSPCRASATFGDMRHDFTLNGLYSLLTRQHYRRTHPSSGELSNWFGQRNTLSQTGARSQRFRIRQTRDTGYQASDQQE